MQPQRVLRVPAPVPPLHAPVARSRTRLRLRAHPASLPQLLRVPLPLAMDAMAPSRATARARAPLLSLVDACVRSPFRTAAGVPVPTGYRRFPRRRYRLLCLQQSCSTWCLSKRSRSPFPIRTACLAQWLPKQSHTGETRVRSPAGVVYSPPFFLFLHCEYDRVTPPVTLS